MKTKTENKNRNTFKATFLRLTAIFISVILLSFTVNAQEFWRTILTNNSINEIAAVLVERTETKKEAAPSSLISHSAVTIALPLHETIEEETLEAEDWMFDESYFQSIGTELNEMEQPMELEPWMENENHFNNETETEKGLQLEAWMTDESHWG